MDSRKSRFSLSGIGLLLCGLLTLMGFFALQSHSASAASPAFVRIIHASPYVGTADVFVDGSPFLTSFGFGAVTDYKAVPATAHKVQIALQGKGINASALTETLPVVQAGVAYTVAALGTSPTNLSLQVFVDDNKAASGQAKVRVYQLSPDAQPVQVTASGQSVVDALPYQKDSDYFNLPTGSYMFSFSPVSLSTSLALKANIVYSVFVVGMVSGSPKIELVPTETPALPGLPSTGSDPSVIISEGWLSTPWLLIALAAIVVGGTLFTRRLFAR